LLDRSDMEHVNKRWAVLRALIHQSSIKDGEKVLTTKSCHCRCSCANSFH
jgi:hypothetical protein